MSDNFSSWVLSIVGVILISVIVEIVLPHGSVGKFIKSILSIFIIFVMISPVVTFKNTNFFEKIFNQSAIEIDVEYIKKVNKQKVAEYEKNILESFDKSGYHNVVIKIDAEIDKDIKINKVYVDICDLVLSENLEHIDKYTNMIAIIKSIIDIKKENIVFNEWKSQGQTEKSFVCKFLFKTKKNKAYRDFFVFNICCNYFANIFFINSDWL